MGRGWRSRISVPVTSCPCWQERYRCRRRIRRGS